MARFRRIRGAIEGERKKKKFETKSPSVRKEKGEKEIYKSRG